MVNTDIDTFIIFEESTMDHLKFNKELYPKVALIKAAYNFTDSAYVHLDADNKYYYVDIEPKSGNEPISELEFTNEMLTQSIRHEVYSQTKNIRELLMARAMATSLVMSEETEKPPELPDDSFSENEILKDWFENND